MRKLFTLAIVFLASILQVEAGQVNEQEARQKAMSFMTKRSMTRGLTGLSRVYAPLKTASAMESVNDAPLYIFNLDGGGYVIVSGDDRTSEILGFSEKGHINPNRMPLNMRNWLDGYVKKIQQLPANVMPQQQIAGTRAVKSDLSPKLHTAWGQDWPYNLHAPELNVVWKDKERNVHAATGCIATSMSQMMNYYRYPNATLIGADSYTGTADVPVENQETGEKDNVQVDWVTENIPAGAVIDWANITDRYDGNSTEAQVEAVSRLMQYCGSSVNMSYGIESTAGVDDMVYGLYDTFGYKDVYLLHQMNYDAQGWIDAIYNVISKEGPVLFGGDIPGDAGGHQFILDGYKNIDGGEYFYANWGWDGEDDGYMLLDVMSPGWSLDDGTVVKFTEKQVATPGMGPGGVGVTSIDKNLYCEELSFGEDGKVYERRRQSDGFPVEYVFWYFNYDHPHTSYQMGIGFFQNNSLVDGFAITDRSGIDLPLFSGWGAEWERGSDLLPIGDGLDDGVYQIKLICSVADADAWKVCRFGDERAVTMTIKGNTATFGNPPSAITPVTKDLRKDVDTGWYSLSGISLNGAPSAKGIYIHNGRKVVIK